MIKYTIQNIEIKIPESINEITTKQFISIYPKLIEYLHEFESTGYIPVKELICDLLEIDFDICLQLPESIINRIQTILNINLDKLIKNFKTEIDISKFTVGHYELFYNVLLGCENKFKTPEILAIIQKQLKNAKLNDKENNILNEYNQNVFTKLIEKSPVLCAIANCNGKIDAKEIEKQSEIYLNEPFILVVPQAFFLLKHYEPKLVKQITDLVVIKLLTYYQRRIMKEPKIQNSQVNQM